MTCILHIVKGRKSFCFIRKFDLCTVGGIIFEFNALGLKKLTHGKNTVLIAAFISATYKERPIRGMNSRGRTVNYTLKDSMLVSWLIVTFCFLGQLDLFMF